MTKKIAAGQDIDFQCTRCKMLLAHTIIAMVAGEPARVKCNTCHTERKWRRTRTKKTSTTKRTGSAARKAVDRSMSDYEKQTEWKALMEMAVTKKAARRPFSVRETFEDGQIIEHTKFGDGIVKEVRGDGKVMVVFVSGTKLMVHGRG